MKPLMRTPAVLSLAARWRAAARAEIVERVVAKVNGDIVTLSEFEARQVAAAAGRARRRRDRVEQFLRENNARILQEAIDELLLVQQRRGAGDPRCRPPTSTRSIEGIKKENNIASDDAAAGAAPARGHVARRPASATSSARPAPAGAAARAGAEDRRRTRPRCAPSTSGTRRRSSPRPATVTLQEILIPEDEGGLALAREVLERARAGEDFAALAPRATRPPPRAPAAATWAGWRKATCTRSREGGLRAARGRRSRSRCPSRAATASCVVAEDRRAARRPTRRSRTASRDRVMMSRFDKAYDDYVAGCARARSWSCGCARCRSRSPDRSPRAACARRSSLWAALRPQAPGSPPLLSRGTRGTRGSPRDEPGGARDCDRRRVHDDRPGDAGARGAAASAPAAPRRRRPRSRKSPRRGDDRPSARLLRARLRDGPPHPARSRRDLRAGRGAPRRAARCARGGLGAARARRAGCAHPLAPRRGPRRPHLARRPPVGSCSSAGACAPRACASCAAGWTSRATAS